MSKYRRKSQCPEFKEIKLEVNENEELREVM